MFLPSGEKNKKRPVLHIVNSGTRFSATSFLPEPATAANVWNTYVRAWSTLYVGMPLSLLVDNGSVFVSSEWKYACNINSIQLQSTGIESHNSLSAGETYQAYLRRCYNKIRADFPKLSDELLLAMATKAMNDTAGPSGLIPTLLVFGCMPRNVTIPPTEYPAQKERIRAAQLARSEFERIVTAERLRIAANTSTTPAASEEYLPGDLAYVYREKFRKYTGPHMVAAALGKKVTVHFGDRRGPRSFNKTQLKRAPMPNAYSEQISKPTYPMQLLHLEIHHTEVIPPNDPRSSLLDDEKKQELLGLIEKGTFRIVLKENAGPNPNILPSRYVLAIKHAEDGSTKLKARFVVGGHKDTMKNSLPHNSPTIRPESLRILLALATILGMDLTTCDWTQGYVQSKQPLLRKVFVRPD